MDKLRALKYFIHLTDSLSFTKTADHFSVPASSVSRRITDLEQELGVLLFQRSTRSVTLTDLGRLYFEEISPAVRSIDLADELIGQQSQSPSGLLKITVMPGFGQELVLPALDALKSSHPDIVFDVHLTDQVLDLTGDAIDIAIRVSTKPPENVVARRLSEQKYILVASPQYLSANGTPESAAELKFHPALMYRGPNGILNWQQQTNKGWQRLAVEPVLISNHFQSLRAAATAGQGIALLPTWSVFNQINSGELAKIVLYTGCVSVNDTPDASVFLLYHPPKFRLQKVKIAVEHLISELTFSDLAS